jgi:VWFA-related protein
MRTQLGRVMCLGAVTAAAAIVAVAAQQPSFRSGTNYIRVDVFPTAEGKHVGDLTVADFQVLEDGKPQKLAGFEHISGAAEGSPRTFLLFLDTANVSTVGTHRLAEPLIRLLDSIVGPRDVLGVMTPDMTAAQVEFGRKSGVLERALRANPLWGRRDERTMFDATEQRYIACYPLLRAEAALGKQMSDLAQKMIARRRERRTLDALNDAVSYLGTADARKTVIAITEGWVLYGTDQQLLEPRRVDPDRQRTEEPPGRPGISVRDGKLTTDDPSNLRSLRYPCDADRLALANLDDQQYLKDIVGNANRRNTTFYAIDPRGLAVFDASVNWDRPRQESLPLAYDGANLRAAHAALGTLATGTDGFALFDSNDLDRGMRRIAADVSSYYLLGYYSTNPTPDGKFREIKVRVTRPGVQVRARRGYRAPTIAELSAAAAPPLTIPAARMDVAAALADLDLQFARGSRTMAGEVRLFRRGPTTGNIVVAAAAPVFSRTDRLRVERAVESDAPADGTARLLDRHGQVIPIALTVVIRADETGRRWAATDLVLAPLGAGDYVIELEAGGRTTMTAVRVTR